MKNILYVSVLVSAVLLISMTASAGPGESERKAIEAADAWLALIDSGEYSRSWEQSAEYFRNAVGKTTWKMQLAAVRKPLGKLTSRKVKSAKYSTSLPGAPDGEYVVIQYEASYENKKSAIETVTPMKEANSQWKVSGYYIK